MEIISNHILGGQVSLSASVCSWFSSPKLTPSPQFREENKMFSWGVLWKAALLPALFLTSYLVISTPSSCGQPCDRRFITQPMGPQVSRFFSKTWDLVQTQRCVTMLPMPTQVSSTSMVTFLCSLAQAQWLCSLTPSLTWPSTSFAPSTWGAVFERAWKWDSLGCNSGCNSVFASLIPWFPL